MQHSRRRILVATNNNLSNHANENEFFFSLSFYLFLTNLIGAPKRQILSAPTDDHKNFHSHTIRGGENKTERWWQNMPLTTHNTTQHRTMELKNQPMAAPNTQIYDYKSPFWSDTVIVKAYLCTFGMDPYHCVNTTNTECAHWAIVYARRVKWMKKWEIENS